MGLLRRYPLVSFVALAFAISCAAAAAGASVTAPAGQFVLGTITKFGPSLAGLIMSAVVLGSGGPKRLLAKFSPRNVAPIWWGVAIAGPLLVWCAALIVWQSTGGAELYVDSAALLTFGPLLARRFFLGGGLGEELGWRGFMLPRLLERRSPLAASLILGVCWGLWHAPAFWGIGGGGKQGGVVMLALFTLYCVALAIVFTWVWLNTGGNLLVASLLHASLNATENWIKAVLPPVGSGSAATLIYGVLILLLALAVAVTLIRIRKATVARDCVAPPET